MALTDKLTAIANAIRSKTGKSATLTLEQMVTEITGIETGGGLPTGISEVAYGESTLTSDQTSGIWGVSHGMSATPNFVFVMIKTDTVVNGMITHIAVTRRGNAVTGGIRYYNSSGAASATTLSVNNGSAWESMKQFLFSWNPSTCTLKGGHTYIWMCGVIDGIG